MKTLARVLPAYLLSIIAILVSFSSALAQYHYDIGKGYGLLGLYEHSWSDSLTVQSAAIFAGGLPLGNSRFVYEFQFPIVAGVKFEGRDEEGVIAATPFAAGCFMGLAAWTMVALGYDDEQINESIIYMLAPFGSHIGYRPTRWLTLYGGMVPEVILFTATDGMIAQFKAGVRVDSSIGLAATVGIQKTTYWGWDRPSRTFPTGFLIGITFAPTHGGPFMQ